MFCSALVHKNDACSEWYVCLAIRENQGNKKMKLVIHKFIVWKYDYVLDVNDLMTFKRY